MSEERVKMFLWEYLAAFLLFGILLLIAMIASGFGSVLEKVRRPSSRGRPQIVVAKGKLLRLVVYMPPADS
jgi:hypothetical protein